MIAIANDHSALDMKKEIIALLDEMHLEYKDFGTYTSESCHYPIYAARAARAVASGECDRGILLCGTGIGIGLAANKIKGIRCATCSEPYSAELTRRHNDANMLAMGAAVVGKGLAMKIVDAFLGAQFEGGRHATRVGMIGDVEAQG